MAGGVTQGGAPEGAGEGATQEGRAVAAAVFVQIPPHPLVRRGGGRTAPEIWLLGSPFQAEKAGTHHNVFIFWPRRWAGCSESLQGLYKKLLIWVQAKFPVVHRIGEDQSSVEQRREHPYPSQRAAGAVTAQFGFGETRRKVAAPPGGGSAGAEPGAATRGRARTGNGLGRIKNY